MRDRLKELLKQAQDKYSKLCFEYDRDSKGKTVESFEDFCADYILADGWIRPPCKVGQTVWYVCKHYNGSTEVMEGKISMLQQKADKSWKFRLSHNSSVWDFKAEDIGVKYFLTKEEAEAKMNEIKE